MKMEVVLSSPGRFGDDGTPFKSEEIREWSRVDRLTGMLERARIETGRWRASNDASAHSYGKLPQVTDQRERNSADGSVKQKARRQVEIFQSKEPGRSVQVVRASQWSSSRVTDNVESILPDHTDSVLNDLENVLESDPWTFPSLSISPMPDLSPSNSLQRLKKSLKAKNSLDNYFLPKRSNSDDELSSLVGSSNSSRLSTGSFTRDCKNRRSLQHPRSASLSTTEDSKNSKSIYSSIAAATSGPCAASIKIGEQKSSDYGALRRKIISNRPNAVTVVNLMNPESFNDDSRGKKSIVTLGASPVPTPKQTRKLSSTKTSSSGDEGTINLPGRATKKVGFSKTEVHFAADSGKVNIVETDGKPPPTNKFRRRRRNSSGQRASSPLTMYSPRPDNVNGRIVMRRSVPKALDMGELKQQKGSAIDNDNAGAYCVVDLESRKFWVNSDEPNGRLHTTTVNLPLEMNDLKQPHDLASPKAVSDITRRIPSQNDCNIVTKDSENNRVLSTIVKTHESTTARVPETRPTVKKSTDDVSTSKKNENSDSNLKKIIKKSGDSDGSKMDNHVYANVFKTSNDTFPIYENYRLDNTEIKSPEISAIDSRESTSLVSEVAKSLKNTLERTRNKTKSPNKHAKRTTFGSLGRSSITTNSIGKSQQRDLIKTKATKRSPTSSEAIKSSRKSSPTGVESAEKRSKIKTGSTRTKKQPMEVVYETAVYNMKNEKLNNKTGKGKDAKAGPRYINDLICGGKTNRPSNTKHKSFTSSQATNKGATQTIRHWK